MKTAEVPKKTYRDLLESAEGSFRRPAYERFKTLGFPGRKMESWKYLALEPLLETPFEFSEKENQNKVDPGVLNGFFPSADEAHRVVFLNGWYSKELSRISELPPGVVLESSLEKFLEAGTPSQPHLETFLSEESNAFAALNEAFFKSGLFLYIPDKVILEKPVYVLFLSVPEKNKEAVSFYPRLWVSAGVSTRLKLIVQERDLGQKTRYFSDGVAEIFVNQGACVEYFQVQRTDEAANTFFTNRFYLKRHASVDAVTVTEGGAVTRNETFVNFEEEHGFCSLKGLSILKGRSQAFHHLTALHAAPHCISRQYYKSILADEAKSEFNSLVRVRDGAVKSDSKQLVRNLLLSDAAEAYSRPQLKIDTDDVSCTHGATTGQLDPNELFYLRSRGLSEKQARALMVYGFADEIIGGIREEVLKAGLEKSLETDLQGIIKNGGFEG